MRGSGQGASAGNALAAVAHGGLRVEGLTAGYGKHQVLDGVSLVVGEGEFVALLGHNGAGKTTALKSLIGLVKPTAGTVSYDGEVLTGRPVHVTAAAGLGLVPQGQGMFPSLTIEENLSLASSLGRQSDSSSDRAGALNLVYELFGILRDRSHARAGSLSGGQRQMLAIAMALLTSPRILLLDEPSTGLAPVLVEEVLASVKRINDELGTSVLVVEQDIKRVIPFADRVYVLKLGSMAFAGSVDEFRERDWSELF